MKNLKVKSSILVGLCSLCMALPLAKKSTLPEIARPYLGEYECILATLGSEEILSSYDYIKLELKPNGSFVLSYQMENGEKGEESGEYSYDENKQELRVRLGKNGIIKRNFPLQNGEIVAQVRIGLKMLTLKFEQK